MEFLREILIPEMFAYNPTLYWLCMHYYDLPLKKDDGKIISLDILYKVDLIMMDNEFDGCHGVTLEGEQKKMTNGLLSSLSCVSYLSDKTVGMFKYFSVQIISDYYHSIILCIPSMLNWEYGIESWQLTVPGSHPVVQHVCLLWMETYYRIQLNQFL